MIKEIITVSLFLIQIINAFCQSNYVTMGADCIVDSLWSRSETFLPAERIFIHTDRDHYSQSDTIWFKAYVRGNDEFPDGFSNFIYIDLVNDRDSVICRTKIKRTGSGFYGSLAIDQEYKSGGYTLRGYSYWMLNFGKSEHFHKPVFISSPNLVSKPKESSEFNQSNRIRITRRDDVFYIELEKECEDEKFIALYNSNGLFSLEPFTKQKETFSLDATQLPFGEMFIAVVDRVGRVRTKSNFSVEPKDIEVGIKSNIVTDGDSRNISLEISAPHGDYSLSIVKSSMINVDLNKLESLLKSPAIDFESSLRGDKQNLDHYIELEQVVSGQVSEINRRTMSKGLQVMVLFNGIKDFSLAYVDPTTRKFTTEALDIIGPKFVSCKLVTPKGVTIQDCSITIDTPALPDGVNYYNFTKKLVTKDEVTVRQTEIELGIDQKIHHIDEVVITSKKRSSDIYGPQPFTSSMAKYNTLSNREVYVGETKNNMSLYQILQSNQLLFKYKDRSNPIVKSKERSPDRFAKSFSSDEGKMPDDWLWDYVLDGMPVEPDEAIFNELTGTEIKTIQIIGKPHSFLLFGTNRIVIAIETKNFNKTIIKNRSYAKQLIQGYSVPVDFKTPTTNVLLWNPALNILEGCKTLVLSIPESITGRYSIILQGITKDGAIVSKEALIIL